MRARLKNIRWEAEGINSYILEPVDGGLMPAFEPGAHVDVQLSPGLARSYSLVNDPAIRSHYEIAVHHAIDSRGGSRHIHEQWRVGQILDISDPKNNFPMVEDASHTVMIAGGIGITPMLPMIARLKKLGRSWELHYVAASPDRAAYVDRLSDHDRVEIAYDGIPGGRRLDLAAICAAAPADAHLYCCGPGGMLEAFVATNCDRPKGHAHIEYFSAETEVATEGGYTLELAKSGKTISVDEGETMLDALLSAGVDIGFACAEGICGTCEVKVLSGVPDHRDHFLTDEDKAANTSIMVCCSGSKTPTLVLDI
ncbi:MULTISPECIES: PDR/VanB family oxidoreductase [Sphingobium]|nr:PDR/VanB family oxidoreductase [Sphingobium yanoikuyae]NBB42333.1 2Fe-2S iron-sulfur cluster binding domain-containing protein [Sphingobium yanoikuyae]